MNILVACDSFKDALPADAVCCAIAAGLQRSHPDARITEMPLSDGGEGLLDVLGHALDLHWIEKQVADPLDRPVTGRYGLSADGMTAVVEIKTGEKSVLSYLLKPINRAREALRER